MLFEIRFNVRLRGGPWFIATILTVSDPRLSLPAIDENVRSLFFLASLQKLTQIFRDRVEMVLL